MMLRSLVAVAVAGWLTGAQAQERTDAPHAFEARLGLFGQLVESSTDRTDPIYGHGELLMPTIGPGSANAALDVLLTPRPHIGATIAAGDGVNQVFAGLTWDLPVTRDIRLEASFGGTLHDGNTSRNDPNAPELGCNVLFRESVALSVAVTQRLTVTAMIDHSSNAGLCDANDGLTHAGLLLGVTF